MTCVYCLTHLEIFSLKYELCLGKGNCSVIWCRCTMPDFVFRFGAIAVERWLVFVNQWQLVNQTCRRFSAIVLYLPLHTF